MKKTTTTHVVILVPVILAALGSATAIPGDPEPAESAVWNGGDDIIVARSSKLSRSENKDSQGLPTGDQLSGVMAGHKSFGALLGAFKNRVVYFSTAKRGRHSAKEVMSKLKAFDPPREVMRPQFIGHLILGIILIILGFMLIFGTHKPGSMQYTTVGLDDGKGKDISAISWDLSSDDAHSLSNEHEGRPIISHGLRSLMLDQGHSNVTFMHHDSPDGRSRIPTLHYTTDDGTTHYHWRPISARPPLSTRQDKEFKKHYAYFDSDGAGFKISAQSPITDHPQLTKAEAHPIADTISKDFVNKRTTAAAVGYRELVKTNPSIGHKICIIAEAERFDLNNELSRCFGAESGA